MNISAAVPVPASRSAVFLCFLVTMAISNGLLALTWWAPATPGRAAGVDWVPWMSPQVVAALWTLSAVAAALGVALALTRGERARSALVWVGVILVIVPALIGAYFLGASVLWWSGGGGSESGWITAAAYLTRALISAWALGVHVGAFDGPVRPRRESYE